MTKYMYECIHKYIHVYTWCYVDVYTYLFILIYIFFLNIFMHLHRCFSVFFYMSLHILMHAHTTCIYIYIHVISRSTCFRSLKSMKRACQFARRSMCQLIKEILNNSPGHDWEAHVLKSSEFEWEVFGRSSFWFSWIENQRKLKPICFFNSFSRTLLVFLNRLHILNFWSKYSNFIHGIDMESCMTT